MSEFTPQAVTAPRGPRAGFGVRLGEYLIDGVLLGVVYGIVWAATSSRGIAYGVGIVVGIAYFVYFEGGPTGQTIGKRAVGVRVYDLERGGPIGYGRALVRYLGKIVSSIPCALGFFWMLWDGEKQTWHDKFAGSIVVPVSTYPVQR
jgi:uncharacterized RDD family membrane protein YckC